MKKVLALIVTLALFLNIVSVSANVEIDSSEKSKAVKQLIVSKSELKDSYKWKKYIEIVDKFIETNKNNEEKLEEIYNKINPLLEGSQIEKTETLNIIKYMNARVTISLIDLYESKVEATVETIIESNSTISDSDKKIIEDKIIELQLNALDKSIGLVENLTKEFENLSNYEETWDFEIDLNIDHDSIWTFEWNVKINDYTSKNSGFDSQLKWEVEALINALPNWEEEIKLQLNTMIDFISKDWNMYLLLEKFEILQDEWVEEIQEFLDKAVKIAAENKYIKYSDPQTQASLDILKTLNPTNIINDSKRVLSEPLITAYKKEWEKYYLIPTKYACDEFKKLSNKFDPFNSDSCSENQYKDLVSEVLESWTFYAEMLNNNKTKIGYIWNKELWLEKNEWYLIFDESGISEFNYEIDAGTDWWLLLEFISESKLNFTFEVMDEIMIKLTSELSSKNKFEKIDFMLNADNYYETIDAKLTLNDNKINWDINSISNYDNNTFTANITWKTSRKNELTDLAIVYKWSDWDEENLNWSLSFWNSKVYFENNYEWYWNKSEILISATLDQDYLPINWKSSINMQSKWWTYDYETYEYIYDEDYTDFFRSELDITNKSISWYTSFYDNSMYSDSVDAFMTINHEWSYDTDKFELNNSFEFSEEYSQYFDYEWSIISWNFNISIDTINANDNLNIYLNILFGEDEIINFTLSNDWKVEYKDTSITTPINFENYEDVFNIEDDYYY